MNKQLLLFHRHLMSDFLHELVNITDIKMFESTIIRDTISIKEDEFRG